MDIKDLAAALMGSNKVEMEIIKVPEGKTIEQVMTARGFKKVGEQCSCGDHHEWEGPNGEKIVAHGDHDEDDENNEFVTRREKALAGIRRRQAATLEIYDKLKEMEKSIQRDRSERDLTNLFDELVMYAEIQKLKERI